MEIKLCLYPVMYSYIHTRIYIYLRFGDQCQPMMVHTCNPNTWMAGDRKAMMSRPAGAIQQDPISKQQVNKCIKQKTIKCIDENYLGASLKATTDCDLLYVQPPGQNFMRQHLFAV